MRELAGTSRPCSMTSTRSASNRWAVACWVAPAVAWAAISSGVATEALDLVMRQVIQPRHEYLSGVIAAMRRFSARSSDQ